MPSSGWRGQVRRLRRPPSRDGDRGQLAEVGGHERQDARAEEADQARRERDEDRQVVAAHADRTGASGMSSRAHASCRRARRRGTAGSAPGDVASSSRRPPSSRTGIGREPRLELRVGVDVAFAEGRASAGRARHGPRAGPGRRRALVAEVAAIAGVEDQLGKGSGRHRACILGSIGRSPVRVGSTTRIADRTGPDPSANRDWTSVRPTPMMRVLRRDRPAGSPRGSGGDGRLRGGPGTATRRCGSRGPGRAFVAFVFAAVLGVGRSSAASSRSTRAWPAGSCPACPPRASISAA